MLVKKNMVYSTVDMWACLEGSRKVKALNTRHAVEGAQGIRRQRKERVKMKKMVKRKRGLRIAGGVRAILSNPHGMMLVQS